MARGRRTRARLTYADPTRNQRGSVNSKTANDVEGLTNPWAESARGSKIPDEDCSAGQAVTLVWTHTHDSDANGRSAVAVNAALKYTMNLGATMTADQITTWNGTPVSFPDYGTLTNSFSLYRIVSWGVRVYPLLAPTNQSGYFRVVTVADAAAQATAPLVVNSSFHKEVRTYPVANADIHWVSAPVGNGWKEYIGPGTNVVDNPGETLPWETLIVFADGLPASTSAAYAVEVIMHIECKSDLTNIAAAMATPAAHHQPHTLAATSAVRVAQPTHNGPTSVLGRWFKRAARQALSTAGRAALNYMLPGAGNALPMIKDEPLEVN